MLWRRALFISLNQSSRSLQRGGECKNPWICKTLRIKEAEGSALRCLRYIRSREYYRRGRRKNLRVKRQGDELQNATVIVNSQQQSRPYGQWPPHWKQNDRWTNCSWRAERMEQCQLPSRYIFSYSLRYTLEHHKWWLKKNLTPSSVMTWPMTAPLLLF